MLVLTFFTLKTLYSVTGNSGINYLYIYVYILISFIESCAIWMFRSMHLHAHYNGIIWFYLLKYFGSIYYIKFDFYWVQAVVLTISILIKALSIFGMSHARTIYYGNGNSNLYYFRTPVEVNPENILHHALLNWTEVQSILWL